MIKLGGWHYDRGKEGDQCDQNHRPGKAQEEFRFNRHLKLSGLGL